MVEAGGGGVGGGVVEDEGGGQGHSGCLGEAVAEFDGGQRVESEVAEGLVGGDGVGGGVTEHRSGVAADQVQEQGVLLGCGHAGELPGEGLLAFPAGRGLAARADEAAHQGRDGLAVHGLATQAST